VGDDEIERFGLLLLDKGKKKLSVSAYSLLSAAGVDIEVIIRGAGEVWIQEIKKLHRSQGESNK